MKAWIKRILKLAGLFIVIGIVVALVGFAVSGFDFRNLSSNTYETHYAYFTTAKKIDRLVLDFDTTNITVEYTPDADKISVTYETQHTKSGDALTKVIEKNENGVISFTEERSWRAGINFFDFHEMKASVTLPEDFATELDIETDTGDILIKGAKVDSRVKLSTDTGNIKIENSAFSDISVEVDTGDVFIKDTTLSGAFRLEADTGDTALSGFEAGSVSITADTGDVSLKNVRSSTGIDVETDTGDVELNGSIFAKSVGIETDTGYVDLYGSIFAKSVDIETDTGDVDGEEATVDAESVAIRTSTGDAEIRLAGAKSEYEILINVRTGRANVQSSSGGPRKLSFTSSTGDGEFYFAG